MKTPMLLTASRLIIAPLLLAVALPAMPETDAIALGLLAVAVATDVVDGRIARQRNQVTALGGLVDPLADAAVFLSLFCAFMLRGLMPWWLFAIVLYRELLMHGVLRPFMLLRGIVVSASKSGKAKTALQSVAGVTILSAAATRQFVSAYVRSWPQVVEGLAFWLLLAAAAMSVGSFLAYVSQAVRQAPSSPMPR